MLLLEDVAGENLMIAFFDVVRHEYLCVLEELGKGVSAGGMVDLFIQSL